MKEFIIITVNDHVQKEKRYADLIKINRENANKKARETTGV